MAKEKPVKKKPAKTPVKKVVEETAKKTIKKIVKVRVKKPAYLYALGRRKTAIARVRLYLNKTGEMMVNDQKTKDYFPGEINQKFYLEPLRTCNLLDKCFISVKVSGSGKSGQLGAVIHGISRALVKVDEATFRPLLKKQGFLMRDPRMKERRKVGTGGKARRQKQSPKR